jgi:transposase
MAELEDTLPATMLCSLQEQLKRIDGIQHDIDRLEQQIGSWQKQEAACRAIADVPGIGKLTATAPKSRRCPRRRSSPLPVSITRLRANSLPSFATKSASTQRIGEFALPRSSNGAALARARLVSTTESSLASPPSLKPPLRHCCSRACRRSNCLWR